MENFRPKAGEFCETKVGTRWVRIMPKYVGKNAIVYSIEDNEFEIASSFVNSKYQPMQTKEERDIAELEYILCSKWQSTATVIAKEILKAGFIKPEQEK